MNIFFLKIIALTAMTIDHAAIAFNTVLPDVIYILMRLVGRIAFPIFAFCVLEGFIHTSSVKKYILRLAAFSLISEISFDLLNYGSVFSPAGSNIMFSFLIAVCVLACMEKNIVIRIIAVLAGCALAYYIKSDYSIRCIMLIIGMYMTRYDKRLMLAVAGVVLLTDIGLIEFGALLALVPIGFYNGKKGKGLKYMFYGFYPGHMIILALIKIMVEIHAGL